MPAFGGYILSVVPGSETSSVTITAEAGAVIYNSNSDNYTFGPDVHCSAFGIFLAAAGCDSTLMGISEGVGGAGTVDATGFHVSASLSQGLPSFGRVDSILNFKEQLVITGGAGSGYLTAFFDLALTYGRTSETDLRLGSATAPGTDLLMTPIDFGVPFTLSVLAYAEVDPSSNNLSFAGGNLYGIHIFDSSAACDVQPVNCVVGQGLPFTGGFFDPTALAPEPGTWVMLLGGMAWMWRARRKRRL